MHKDFSEFFIRYEALVREVDAVFERVKAEHGDAVTCSVGCCDCCYALFDLSLVEAMYLNHHFRERFQGMERTTILDRADAADRAAYKFKRQIYKASEEGKPAAEILADVAKMRIRCPLLNDDNQCDLYDKRPVTCRLYGIPTAIGGESRTCGLTNFQEGVNYPTVNVEVIQDKLMLLSQALVDSLNTKHASLAEVLVPVSMALMNQYDDEYLGIVQSDDSACQSCDSSHSWTLGEGGEKETQAPGVSCSGCHKEGACDQSQGGVCPDGGPAGGAV